MIRNEEFILHPLKFIFRTATNTLICADLHIGKGAHFRENGIALPRQVNKNNFWNLSEALELYKPKTLMILGDMVHSKQNLEWTEFSDFLDNYPAMTRTLVRGNHELFEDKVYSSLGFEVFEEIHDEGFTFCHEPLDSMEEDTFHFCGHVHPALSLFGAGRQRIKVPCFYLSNKGMILPSFGEFTGSHVIRPQRGERVFAISGKEVIEIIEVLS